MYREMEAMKGDNSMQSLTAMGSSSVVLPLAPTSFQVWKKKPYLMIGSSTENKSSSSNFQRQQYLVNSSAASLYNKNPPPDHHDSVRARTLDANMDPRKLKRIISNRLSAQKSRMKKLQYVTKMERKLKALEAQIAVLSPQVALFKNQQHLLQMEQKSLNQRMAAFTNDRILKDAEIEEKKAEVSRLRQLQLRQQQQKMQAQMGVANVWGERLIQRMVNGQGGETGEVNGGESNSQMVGLMNLQEAKSKSYWGCARMEQMSLSLNQSVEQAIDSNRRGLGGIEQIILNQTTNNNAFL